MEACGCSDFFSGDAHSMVVHGDFAPAAFSGMAVIGSEVVRRFALAVCDGSATSFDAVLLWFARSVADVVVLLLRSGARWCKDEARPSLVVLPWLDADLVVTKLRWPWWCTSEEDARCHGAARFHG